MQTPDERSAPAPDAQFTAGPVEEPVARAAVPSSIAPVWHTVVLIAAIVVISVSTASRIPGPHAQVHRLATYGLTALMDLALIGWVWLGLRLRKRPMRSILGSSPLRLRLVILDIASAAVFWFASMMILGTLAVTWAVIQAAITHQPLIRADGKPDPAQQRTLKTLEQLAPSDRKEIAAWAALCILVGFAEECVFRGYLQQQFIAWGRGRAVVGVVFSAILFGAGHGYQGARSMFLIAVFGALFSVLALLRRSLRAGMIAHSWHDLATGLALALLKSQHIV